jgi:flavin-dependent dehydrogenase
MSGAGGFDVDVIVVGGGPIGLAAAVDARLEGLSVAVIEPRSGTIDKACGEAVMPGAVAALARLGVFPEGQPIAGFRYLDARGESMAHRFSAGRGIGVRRTALHDALSGRADELGVIRIEGKVTALDQDADSVTVAGLRGRWLLGCDGLHSSVRRLADLERPVARTVRNVDRRRFGLRQHFQVSPWTDLVEVHWGKTAEIYVTPIGSELVGVAVLGPRHTDFAAALAATPALSQRLAGASPANELRGAGPLRQRTTARSRGQVLLVGDASGYVDALTGEGIRVGLAQAHEAIAAILPDGGGARAYERASARATRDFRIITTALLTAAQSPVRGAIVPLARTLPRVFGAAVERLAR